MWQSGDLFEQKKFEYRLRYLGFFFTLCFIMLLSRLFVLQIVKGSFYVKLSESNRTQLFFQRAPRGIIFDRAGIPIADNAPKISVLFSPLNLGQDALEDVVKRLSVILGRETEDLWNVIRQKDKASAVSIVAEDISRDVLFKLEESSLHLPGISINMEPRRRYLPHGFASHIIGYLGEISRNELKDRVSEGYKMGDVIGKQGVEKVYDAFLKGKDGGFQLEVDAAGRSKRILYQIDTEKGADIYLTVDIGLQKVIEDYFIKNNYIGAAVAIDPSNGKILALCSFPNYDPNLFVMNAGDISSIVNDERTKPLLNRAIQGQYPPGSIFKIISSAAMLEKQGFNPNKKVKCEGSFTLGGARGRTFKCWESKGHGNMDFISAVAKSCDVYFYVNSLECGPESIMEIASDFNLGRFSSIDLPGEEKGLVPTPGWKKKNRKEQWYRGDTLNLGIGQGYLLFTPIQAAVMIASVAGRGLVWRPYLADKVVDNNGVTVYSNEPFLLNKINLLPQTWDLIDKSLKEVVSNGTGAACRVDGLDVAGKTGTAQNPHGDDHAWFCAYAGLPGSEPAIAVAVLVAHGEHGASAAAPAAREIIKEFFKRELSGSPIPVTTGRINNQ